MRLIVNGEVQTLRHDHTTVLELLKECKVEMPDMVSVQVNGEFVDRTAFATRQVKDGDAVDFLYFMGGGAR